MPEAPQAKEVKVHYKKGTSFWMSFGVACFFLLLSIFNVGFLEDIENKTIDLRFGVRGVRQPQVPIKIVGVDDKSLEEIGQWPWPRATQALLARKLKADGAKCIFFDVVFAEPERTQEKMLKQLEEAMNSSIEGSSKTINRIREKVLSDIGKFQATQNGDKVFAAAMKETGNIFLPIVPFTVRNNEEGRMPNPESLHATEAKVFGNFTQDFLTAPTLTVSIPELQNNVLDSGHIRFIDNHDGIYRCYPTVIKYQEYFIPALALQISRYFLDDKEPVKVHVDECYAEVAGRKIPLLDNGFAFINYCGPRNVFPSIPASDVLKDRVEPGTFKGAVVLIGAIAAGLGDLRPTPFTKASPGVNINANIIENVVSRNFLSLAPNYWKILLVFLLAMAMWYLVPRLTPTQATFYFFGLFIAYVAVACLFFSLANTIINMTYPILSMVLTFVVLTTYKFRTEVKYSRYLKQSFQSMVAPTVVEEILKLPSGIELGGEEKQLTVMFSDIRGFTTFSEKHTPPEVVEILNEYLTQMTLLIFQTEGTLDKYIGDAIMAFWGAPVPQNDNAYRACSTALGMVDLLHTVLHPKWELEGKEKLQIGIGLNTGGMVVGFVGSQSIKNYTLIGDAVNLGSRLEGTTKEYHVEVIIAETTYEQVKNDMLCRELDLIKVKGKNEPIRIYELVDHRLKGAGAKEMKVKAFEEGLSLYRAQKWDEASKCFKNCKELDPKDGPAEIFLERCSQLKRTPPPIEWDGVFVMKTK